VGGEIAARGVDVLDLGWQVGLVLAAVDERHGVPGGEQLGHQGAADEAGAAEQQDAHRASLARRAARPAPPLVHSSR
jgi:hypothetical protein